MTFLEKLDLLMERDHLNRRALSRKAGIPYNTIDNWYKRGYEGLKLSTAGKLAEFFGTTTDFFLREELRDPDYGKTAGFQVDFPEMTFLQKRRALDDYGKQAVDAVLEADIHDRVNYAVESSRLEIEPERKLCIFTIEIATEICPVMEYFEIFLERMVLCRKAAQTLGLQFELIINGTRLL